MTKRNKSEKKPVNTNSPASNSISTGNIPAIILVSLYLLVDFIPLLDAIETMGPQWFYVSIINVIVSSYIYFNASRFKNIFNKFFGNTLSICYVTVFVLSGISIFFAINPIESFVVYARFVVTIVAFFNIGILLYDRFTSVTYLWQGISIIVFIQCVPLLYSFLQTMGTESIDAVILNLKSNTGNKNILAASLIIKLPFVMYCVFSSSTLPEKIFHTGSFLLAVLLIFILNARAAYLALFVQAFMFVILCIKLNYSKAGLAKTAYSCLRIILPLAIAFIVAQMLLSSYKDGEKPSAYGTITERASSIVSSDDSSINARFFFWENALDYIKNNPFTGSGYGNWKLASLPYEKGYNNDFNYSKHAHNDFLEITAETGIPAGLLFISIFIFALVSTLKVWKSDISEKAKIISVFSLISLAGYFVDAFFNFPAERPVMQIFFAFALGINITVFTASIKRDRLIYNISVSRSLLTVISLLLLVASGYLTYTTYRSMTVQRSTHYDFGKNTSNVKWQEVNSKFPTIPNLSENNVPINVVKAWYLYRDRKFHEALFVLNDSPNANPHSMLNEWMKASIFTTMGQIDSAYYYAKKGFGNRPRNILLYNLVSRLAVRKNDTETIKQSFREYNRYRDEPHAWRIYIRSLFAVNYNKEELLNVTDSVSRVYPDDQEMKHTKFFVHAGVAYIKKDFKGALKNLNEIMKIFPEDYENIENLGLTYFFIQDYTNAAICFDKVVRSKAYNNGKSEFYLGLSLHKTGKGAEGCRYLSVAAAKNFPDANKYLGINCK